MRVLSVAWECPSSPYGGLGTVLSRLLPAMSRIGHEVLHLCTWGESWCRELGGFWQCSAGPTLITKEGAVLHSEAFELAASLVRMVWWPELVLAHDLHGAPSVLVADEFGIDSVLVIHAPSGSGVEAEACRRAKRLIAVSRLVAVQVTQMYGVPEPDVVHWPPPIEPREPVEKRGGTITILILTRFQVNKDPGWALRILDTLARRGLKFRVVLAGRGTALYGYSYPWLEVVGDVDEETKVRLLSEAHLLLYPSTYEPYGLVPLEAVALGTPALYTIGCGVAEALGAEGALDPSKPEEVAEILRNLIEDEGERRKLLEAQRSKPVMSRRWEDVAMEIVKK